MLKFCFWILAQEDNKLRNFAKSNFGSVAQSVEQRPFKPLVVRSIRTGVTSVSPCNSMSYEDFLFACEILSNSA